MVKFIQGYTLNEAIGEGNFGLVYRATHKEKSGIFAVKVIPVQKFQQNQRLQIYTNNQIQALQTIGISDYIIRFYQIIKSKNNCYLVYQFCNGGTLLGMLKRQQRLEEKKALWIFRQLLQAFKVLNKNCIMHRDLKPENIFFTTEPSEEQGEGPVQRKKVKLGDFGFCKGLKPDQNLAKTMLGSPIYMAPQVLKGEAYTTKADIWSLGVILFQMLYGYCPYESKSIASLINTIDTQPVQLPTKIIVSQRTQNLIKRMLTKDYFRRIGWVQLFGIRIDQNGQYIDQPPSNNLSASEDRSSTPNKKLFGSLFGSLSLGMSNQLPTNNRSYSTIREEQGEKRNQMKIESKIGAPIKILKEQQVKPPQVQVVATTPTQVSENRGSSQPKDQRRFYSHNYINILSTPLSLKKIEATPQPNSALKDKSKQKSQTVQTPTVTASTQNNSSNNPVSQPNTPTIVTQNSYQKQKMPQKAPVSPVVFRQQRITSMDTIDLLKQQSQQMMMPVSANNISSTVSNTPPAMQPIPFNKYRQNIGMPSKLSSQFLSDRLIKQPTRHSSQYTPSSSMPMQLSSMDPQVDLTQKRINLLKLHQSITKTLLRTMSLVQQKFQAFKINRQISDFCVVKDLLQDSYIILKIIQQKLKQITQSIKITETSLLDLASIINYEHIQVQKFIIEVRNQLIRCSVQLPNVSNNSSNGNGSSNGGSNINNGLHLSKVDRVQNANYYRDMIKSRSMGGYVDQCLAITI